MSKYYAYQIKGILEKPNKQIGGIRVVVCTPTFFETVDVPATIFDKATLSYLKFRLAVNDFIDVKKLPEPIISRLRNPMNQWLDNWVLMELK
jgi:hypothetical protein